MNMAGRCHENGWGTPKDNEIAADWYRRSAEQGDEIAPPHRAHPKARDHGKYSKPAPRIAAESGHLCPSGVKMRRTRIEHIESALPPLALRNRQLRATTGLKHRSQKSFDNVISAGKQCRRQFETERLSSLKVDEQLNFCGLLDRQTRRLFAL